MVKFRLIPVLLAGALALPGGALAAGAGPEIEDHAFSWEGPFGRFDRLQLQRGLQVYIEVCAACHGLKFASFRELGRSDGPAMPEEQIKAIAAMFEVPAKVGEPYTDADGERVDAAEPGDFRPAKPSDKFPEVTSASAPDLTKMVMARAGFHGPYGLGINQMMSGIGGAEYVHALLTGYHEPPACAPEDFDGYYNTVFGAGGYPDECKIFEEDADGNRVEVGRKAPGSWISMPPPLDDDLVEYVMHGGGDHSAAAPPATVDQMSEDVTAFLMFAAEPYMIERKSAGFKWVLYLVVLSVLLYFTNKTLWASIKRKD